MSLARFARSSALQTCHNLGLQRILCRRRRNTDEAFAYFWHSMTHRYLVEADFEKHLPYLCRVYTCMYEVQRIENNGYLVSFISKSTPHCGEKYCVLYLIISLLVAGRRPPAFLTHTLDNPILPVLLSQAYEQRRGDRSSVALPAMLSLRI